MLSRCRFLRDASPRRAIGTVLSCIAGTGMISTARDEAAALNVRVPPVWTNAVHGADNGPTMSLALTAQAAVGFPVIVSAFFAMKLASGPTITMAAFFAATISPVVECGAADTTSGVAHVPDARPFNFRSPIWSPWAWLRLT